MDANRYIDWLLDQCRGSRLTRDPGCPLTIVRLLVGFQFLLGREAPSTVFVGAEVWLGPGRHVRHDVIPKQMRLDKRLVALLTLDSEHGTAVQYVA